MSTVKPLAKTYVGNYFISTVELPFGSTFEEEVFETMVFDQDSDRELDMERCVSKGLAMATHALMTVKWGNK